jgi:hypothetical protein
LALLWSLVFGFWSFLPRRAHGRYWLYTRSAHAGGPLGRPSISTSLPPLADNISRPCHEPSPDPRRDLAGPSRGITLPRPGRQTASDRTRSIPQWRGASAAVALRPWLAQAAQTAAPGRPFGPIFGGSLSQNRARGAECYPLGGSGEVPARFRWGSGDRPCAAPMHETRYCRRRRKESHHFRHHQPGLRLLTSSPTAFWR